MRNIRDFLLEGKTGKKTAPIKPSKEAIEYFKSLHQITKKNEKPKLKKTHLSKHVRQKYEELYGSKIRITNPIFEDMLNYFCQEQSTQLAPALINNYAPSKGILIVGGVGVGKTSILNAFKQVFVDYNKKYQIKYTFVIKNMNDIVQEYELCENKKEKEYFWNRYTKHDLAIDDAKTERHASNFGKINVFKELIEKRYNMNVKTFITANFDLKHQNNTSMALQEFTERYTERVTDRLIEMCNIFVYPNQESERR